jgi:hypothetical protein
MTSTSQELQYEACPHARRAATSCRGESASALPLVGRRRFLVIVLALTMTSILTIEGMVRGAPGATNAGRAPILCAAGRNCRGGRSGPGRDAGGGERNEMSKTPFDWLKGAFACATLMLGQVNAAETRTWYYGTTVPRLLENAWKLAYYRTSSTTS